MKGSEKDVRGIKTVRERDQERSRVYLCVVNVSLSDTSHVLLLGVGANDLSDAHLRSARGLG